MDEASAGGFLPPRRSPVVDAAERPESEFLPLSGPSSVDGDGGLCRALRRAFASLGYSPKDILVVSGDGPLRRVPQALRVYGVCGLPGALPAFAAGAKLADRGLTAIVVLSSSEVRGAGLAGLLHSARANPDILCVCVSDGRESVDPVAALMAAGAGFLARASCSEADATASLLAEALRHKGFSFVECRRVSDGGAGRSPAFGVLSRREGSPSLEELDPANARWGPLVRLPAGPLP